MEANVFSYGDFVTFSNTLDSGITTDNNRASRTLIKAFKAGFGYSAAAVRFENTEDYRDLWVSCIAPDCPAIEEDISFFKTDPFCWHIMENISEQKFFSARESISEFETTELYRRVHKCGFESIGAIPFSDIWSQALVVLLFKKEEFSKAERQALNDAYNMVLSKNMLRNRFITMEEELKILKNEISDLNTTGAVILNEELEIIDSNRCFEEHYRQRLPVDDIQSFFRSIIKIHLSTTRQDDENTRRIIKIDDFEIIIKTQIEETKDLKKNRSYYITIDEGPGEKPDDDDTDLISDDWFKSKYLLSTREMEIVRALVTGLKYQEIAEKFYISVSTVRTHVKNIYKKLNINNQRMLLYMYSYPGKV